MVRVVAGRAAFQGSKRDRRRHGVGKRIVCKALGHKIGYRSPLTVETNRDEVSAGNNLLGIFTPLFS